MKDTARRSGKLLMAAIIGAGVIGATGALAQSIRQVQTEQAPLILKSRGSIMVGGESVLQSSVQVGSPYAAPIPGGHVTINQMYSDFMVPAKTSGLPVIMIHGGTLNGKTYDTTPDGRMGWFEYFVRHGRPVYVPDQIGRARSGFNLAIYNEVRAGQRPPSDLPNAFRLTEEIDWTNFRIGPSFGEQFPGQQFPVESLAELSKQSVPDLIGTLPSPNPTPKALATLAKDLGGAVIISHSQSGPWPLEAALLAPGSVRAAIMVEPGTCPTDTMTDDKIKALGKMPVLMVFGDNLDVKTGMPTSWRDRFNKCQTLIARINAAGGYAKMYSLPDMGIRGNTHMIMQDRNSLQIASLLINWLDQTVDKAGPKSHR